MNTKKWGASGWVFLHTITFNYPIENPPKKLRKHYKELFENFKYTLPCKYCRLSYVQFMKELPIDNALNSRAELTYWFYQLHNKVNNKLREQGLLKKRDPSFPQICKRYESMRASCGGRKLTCRAPPKSKKGSPKKSGGSKKGKPKSKRKSNKRI